MTLPFDSDPYEIPQFEIVVVRSKKRKRSVGAQMKGDVLHISVPSWMSAAEITAWTDKMASSFRRQMSADRINLSARATTLAARYDLPKPTDIRWSDGMTMRWGSCTPEHGTIRISTRLARFPDWVVDSVIVHELCHIAVPTHGPAFWELANRYPKMERAIGYLIAKSGDHDID